MLAVSPLEERAPQPSVKFAQPTTTVIPERNKAASGSANHLNIRENYTDDNFHGEKSAIVMEDGGLNR